MVDRRHKLFGVRVVGGPSFVGGSKATNRTGVHIMVSRRAILPPKQNNTSVQFAPSGGVREPQFKIAFSFGNRFGVTASPSTSQTMNVSINRESGFIKGLHHDDGGGFVTDTGERLEVVESAWDVSVVVFADGGG